jgi:hypothetical protein
LVQRLAWCLPFSKRNRKRVLFVTESNTISRSQIHPYWFYRREFDKLNFEMREVRSERFLTRPEKAPSAADVVVIQAWYTTPAAKLEALLDTARQYNKDARIVFFDAFAPTDLRFAHSLDSKVDAYVKKSILRDRHQYGLVTLGDTNLSDFYGRLYGCADKLVQIDVPATFLHKVRIGPAFFTGESMLHHFFSSPAPLSDAKTLDVHGRLGQDGSPWYSAMRKHAVAALESLEGLQCVTAPGAHPKVYWRELAASKLCFSPFGYGEITWRDYEAVMCGALLLKPDMAHCETDPDIFVSFETYVPVAWDFSDVADKVRYYLRHPAERQAIARRAYERLHDYCRTGKLLAHLRNCLVD